MANISIECNGVTSKVMLDGEDISMKATSVTFTHIAGEVPAIQVTYLAGEARVIGSCINNISKIGFSR